MKAERSVFAGKLKVIRSCVSKTNTLIPIFRSILFEDGFIQAHDGTVFIKVSVDTGVKSPVYIPGHPLISYIMNNNAKFVDIEVDDKSASFKCGRSKIVLGVESAELHKSVEFPKFSSGVQVKLKNVSEVMKRLIKNVGDNVQTVDEMGVCLLYSEGMKGKPLYHFCSTDRASACRIQVDLKVRDSDSGKLSDLLTKNRIVFPVELCRILSSIEDDTLDMSITNKYVLVKSSNVTVFSSVLVSNVKLDFDAIFARMKGIKLVGLPPRFPEALTRSLSFRDNSDVTMNEYLSDFVVKDNKLNVLTKASHGNMRDVVPFEYDDLKMEIDCNRMSSSLTFGTSLKIGFGDGLFITRGKGYDFILSSRR